MRSLWADERAASAAGDNPAVAEDDTKDERGVARGDNKWFRTMDEEEEEEEEEEDDEGVENRFVFVVVTGEEDEEDTLVAAVRVIRRLSGLKVSTFGGDNTLDDSTGRPLIVKVERKINI